MAIDHEQQQVVAGTMPALLAGSSSFSVSLGSRKSLARSWPLVVPLFTFRLLVPLLMASNV